MIKSQLVWKLKNGKWLLIETQLHHTKESEIHEIHGLPQNNHWFCVLWLLLCLGKDGGWVLVCERLYIITAVMFYKYLDVERTESSITFSNQLTLVVVRVSFPFTCSLIIGFLLGCLERKQWPQSEREFISHHLIPQPYPFLKIPFKC